MTIKCVIFDFGDTLSDTTSASKKVMRKRPEKEILKKHGLNFSNTELNNALERMIEKTKRIPYKVKQKDWLIYSRTMLQELGLKNPSKKLAMECEKSYYAKLRENVKLMPNALNALEFLKRKKITTCVISNTRTSSNLKLAKKLGIRKYFRHFIMSHEFGSVKSELKIFHALLKKLNKERKEKIKASECLMVGDNVLEDGAAKRVGMKVAILKPTMHKGEHLERVKPDYLINSLSEIRKIVEKD